MQGWRLLTHTVTIMSGISALAGASTVWVIEWLQWLTTALDCGGAGVGAVTLALIFPAREFRSQRCLALGALLSHSETCRMFDSVRPRDSGKSSPVPDHLRPERRSASWHRSTKLRELGKTSDEIGACGALKTFFSAELRSSLCSTPRTGGPSSSCSHSPRIMSRRSAARRERSD